MIDIASQLASIEKLMRLMETYKMDELSVDYIQMKRSRHLPLEKQENSNEVLDKHTKPVSLAELASKAQQEVNQVESWLNGDNS